MVNIILNNAEIPNVKVKLKAMLKIKPQFPLLPMGVLAPGSAHASPSSHPKSYFLCDSKPHAKFQNPTITPSDRKILLITILDLGLLTMGLASSPLMVTLGSNTQVGLSHLALP